MDPSAEMDVLLTRMADDEEVLRALGGLSDVRVLELHAGADAFCGFRSFSSNQRFNSRMEVALAASCHFCLPTKKEETPTYKWVNGRDCVVGFDLPPRLNCPARPAR